MEFKLNKIDTDIRKKMQEEIKSDKIHGNKNISIKKDIKEDDNKSEHRKNKKQTLEKRFYTIDGIKYTEEGVQIEVEKDRSLDEESYKGMTLNVRK